MALCLCLSETRTTDGIWFQTTWQLHDEEVKYVYTDPRDKCALQKLPRETDSHSPTSDWELLPGCFLLFQKASKLQLVHSVRAENSLENALLEMSSICCAFFFCFFLHFPFSIFAFFAWEKKSLNVHVRGVNCFVPAFWIWNNNLTFETSLMDLTASALTIGVDSTLRIGATCCLRARLLVRGQQRFGVKTLHWKSERHAPPFSQNHPLVKINCFYNGTCHFVLTAAQLGIFLCIFGGTGTGSSFQSEFAGPSSSWNRDLANQCVSQHYCTCRKDQPICCVQ